VVADITEVRDQMTLFDTLAARSFHHFGAGLSAGRRAARGNRLGLHRCRHLDGVGTRRRHHRGEPIGTLCWQIFVGL